MSDLVLLILRLGFLLLLWVFVFAIVYALRSDLFGQRPRKKDAASAAGGTFPSGASSPMSAAPSASAASAGSSAGVAGMAAAAAAVPTASPSLPTEAVTPGGRPGADTARRLVITSGPREGTELDLPGEQLAIGRSSESGLVIRDDYTSTHHARLMLWNDQWVVQDLDSTNGTFLDGQRVTLPTPVPLGTPVTIGQTTFELRR
ncbi:FHA domain-containing protein [Schumannella sp. 10F1B-5-1]|uniref:FHA domain-containing protein FhaB/FipA n=1 Tax=Schumannella sp. 10F1B-5-1 TaxID=2590780 RepID=UPI0011316076|nr:FHA domain-containing protein [Schumannella sp. 10F1B-5-1]TPW76725.1 FHA domain-containing protein [Schumannella sp. 10F1B-5-1]